jgi:oxygen-dependent protoporphyrinogen oxidase
MQDLVDALARGCGPSVRTGVVARSLARHDDADDAVWRIEAASGETLAADVVVLATPAHVSAKIVATLDPALHSLLVSIPTAPLAVVALAFDRAVLQHPLDGFGFLAPGHERFPALGVLWDSSIFPNRAPADRVLLRVILGGARAPDVPVRDDAALVDLARDALRRGMGVSVDPRWTRIVRHVPGLPQYTLGHLNRLQAVDARLEAHAGLYLAGNSYRGVAMNACITDAIAVANRILAGS